VLDAVTVPTASKKAGFASIESHADIPGTMPGGTLIIAEKN
jgi:hypothetical protein